MKCANHNLIETNFFGFYHAFMTSSYTSVVNEDTEGQTLAQDYTAYQWQQTDGNHPQILEIVRLRST